MREIPSLRTLALRVVGTSGSLCSPEIAFGGPPGRDATAAGADSDSDDGDVATTAQTSSSALLQKRDGPPDRDAVPPPPPEPAPAPAVRLLRSLRRSVLPPRPHDLRRNANDVDIAHPWCLVMYPPRDPGNAAPVVRVKEEAKGSGSEAPFLTIENANHAVECVQLLLDVIIESGMGDSRLGVNVFREYVSAMTGHEAVDIEDMRLRKKKKKRMKPGRNYNELPLGALSLHNFAGGSARTFRALEQANVGCCLGTLDLTGVHGLTDALLSDVICAGSFPRLRRLSVKNCRKVTGRGVASLVRLTKLCALDVGGCFNVTAGDVVSLVRRHPSTGKGRLTEIYASGLGWTDVTLEELVDAACERLSSLGVGFSPHLSGLGLVLTLSKRAQLTRLAVPFCPDVDNAAAAELGKKLPQLSVLDVRGCNKVTSLSGIMAERRNADLFVLARYSGISSASLEETQRLYSGVTCVLDAGGIGEAICR